MFLIDISNTPQQHIHTRLRSHFNQMWHILALTFSSSISVVHSAFGPVYRAAAFYSMEYFMKKIKFLTHTHIVRREIWIGNFDLYDLFHMCVPCQRCRGSGLNANNIHMICGFFTYASDLVQGKSECETRRGLKIFEFYVSHNGRC